MKTCEDRRIKALKTVKTQSIFILVLSQQTCKKVGQVKKRFPAWKTIVSSIKFDNINTDAIFILKIDWIGYKLKHLARKQYLLLYLFQMMQQSSLFKIPKYTSFTQRISYRMFIQIHQEALGQYYIAFSCTYLDNWLKTTQEWADNKKTKICFEKGKHAVPD
jgi:uncharacterized membrane protein